MVKDIIAKRYAKAFFGVVQDEQSAGGLDSALDILRALADAFENQPHLRHLVLNPRFDREEKIGVLKSLLKGPRREGPVLRFCEYLIRKNRFQYLPHICRAFAALVEEFHGVMTVPVKIAKRPSGEDEESVRRKLESLTGRKVRIEWTVDPALIGGLVIQVGEARVDGSIRGRLDGFRRKFVEA